MLWWTLVLVNWLMSCQECRRAVFCALLYTSELFPILENKLISNADDSTLIDAVPSPGVRVTVAESPSHYLVKVSDWCDLWWMKWNACKTKTMIVSRSRTMHSQSQELKIEETVLKEFDDLVIL